MADAHILLVGPPRAGLERAADDADRVELVVDGPHGVAIVGAVALELRVIAASVQHGRGVADKEKTVQVDREVAWRRGGGERGGKVRVGGKLLVIRNPAAGGELIER